MATTTGVGSNGSISFSGLSSGIDTSSLVDSFIKIEAGTQNKLKTSVTQHQAKVTAYQNLNTSLNDIKSATQDLALGLNWKAMTASSSSTNVTTTASSSATAGTFTFAVQTLAKANTQITSGSVASLDAPINSSGEKLSDALKRINGDSSLNYTAAAIQVSPGNFKVQLQAKETGTAKAIVANAADFNSMGTLGTVQAAQDATLKVGSGANAYTVTSGTNTMTDVLPGVTLNLTKADPATDITVTVGADSAAMASKVKGIVEAVNSALNYISSNSKYDAASKSGGIFLGNSTTQRLQSTIRGALNDVVNTSLKLAANIGIKAGSDGKFTFDEAAFTAAYTKSPEAVASMFVEGGTTGTTTGNSPGIAERLTKVAKLATDSVSGMLTNAIKGENSTITDLNKSILAWDDRLAKRRETLTKMYNAMESAMAKYNSTGSWLTGQISNMNGNNN